MPVQYEGVIEEHLAVRSSVGVFDVSHMGQVRTSGPEALKFLQRLTSNDVSKVDVGGAQYGLLCAEDGGVLDDLFTYRLADDVYLTVTNAGNHRADFEQFSRVAADFEVELFDAAESTSMLAVQGPAARELVERLADTPLPHRMCAASGTVAGQRALIAGTGYTGEDGVELIVENESAVVIWDALIDAGAVPCGLASRDTLRTEAGFHLYGNDLDTSRNPIEAGLGWACHEQTGFIGSEAVAEARANGTDQRLMAFVMTGPGIARAGSDVVGGGTVSSGTHSPSFGYGIGMAYLPASACESGTEIEIDVRGKVRTAEVRPRPLYRKAD
jgi:aminomethyltransferase